MYLAQSGEKLASLQQRSRPQHQLVPPQLHHHHRQPRIRAGNVLKHLNALRRCFSLPFSRSNMVGIVAFVFGGLQLLCRSSTARRIPSCTNSRFRAYVRTTPALNREFVHDGIRRPVVPTKYQAGLRAIQTYIQPNVAFKMRYCGNIVHTNATRTLSSTSYPGIRLSRFPREFFTCTKRTRRRVSRRVLYEARCCVSNLYAVFMVGRGQPFTNQAND